TRNPISSLLALAAETGPILLYYAANKELIGFLVLPGSAEILTGRIDITRDHLGEQVRGLAHDAANPVYASRERTRARELWDLLIAPFAQRLPVGGPLVLVPHGPLHELPFEALLDPSGSPLFERWDVSVAPSVSTLALTRRRHGETRQQDSFLAFSSGRGLNLPEDEVAAIAGLFGANQATFRPTEARFQSYERLVTKARYLLIATNGSYAPGSRRNTYLEIEPTSDEHDSRLSAAEIAALPLEAELVTLAACDTARGEALLSDERLDLTRAFLIAGAAAVLATRWKVPEDPSTSHFLLDFYRAYRQGGPDNHGQRKDRALTEARRRSLDRGDSTQLWGAWALVGDPR
ncbi:MAG TPA: CHAT domain-containing protein, partial [Thermoanaerobaculia bacterium]